MEAQRRKIGYLIGGGLKENFRVRLTVSPQEVQEGAFVVLASGNWRYYGIVTDIQLGAADLPAPPALAPEPTALLPQVRVIDPRALSGCDIFLESDFPNAVGSVPVSAQTLSDMEKKACLYTFAGTPATLFAGIFTSLPGREAFENVRQFDTGFDGRFEFRDLENGTCLVSVFKPSWERVGTDPAG